MGFLEGILYMLWRGIAIGVIISAPMGPVGILCVQRTLAKGRRAGFFTGVGAAVSDLMYCLLTGFGLSFVEEFLERNQNIIQIIGSVVIIGFAVYLFRSNPSKAIKKPGEISASPKRDIINGFLFTVSNPLIVFLIIGLFARFNFLLPEIQIGHYMVGFLCIILGALGWWWMVTYFIDKVRAHFNLRSMWLINKITGSIIAVFGVVGIITGITSMASAAGRNVVYLNSSRGFGPWDEGSGPRDGSGLLVDGNDTVPSRTLQLGPGGFELRFRARNLHNAQGRRYATASGDKVRNPGWRISAESPGDTLCARIRTIDDYRDPLGPTAIAVTVTRGDTLLYEEGLRDHLDWDTGWNSFVVACRDGRFSIAGGERAHRTLAETFPADFAPMSVSITAEPGALMELDWIELHQPERHIASSGWIVEEGGLDDYLRRSTDPLEGRWHVYERALQDDLLGMGGDYELAVIRDGDGYELLYLAGAEKYPGNWRPGMLKGRLEPTAHDGIYRAEWIDVAGYALDTEIKAQHRADGILEFQFPYHDSTLVLRQSD